MGSPVDEATLAGNSADNSEPSIDFAAVDEIVSMPFCGPDNRRLVDVNYDDAVFQKLG